jgi:hypothetical protein
LRIRSNPAYDRRGLVNYLKVPTGSKEADTGEVPLCIPVKGLSISLLGTDSKDAFMLLV